MNHRIHLNPHMVLADLLETSAARYHRCVAMIQTIFARAYFQVLGERRAEDILFQEEELLVIRLTLLHKQRELIATEQRKREDRDRAIHAYVATLHSQPAAA